MPLEGTYEPSPWEPIAQQVAAYEASDGAEANDLHGKPVIILTTIGAKSGAIRKTPLMRVTDGTKYAVIGSMGGAPISPQWVANLRTTPRAELQDGPIRRDYAVREVTGAERDSWWEIATAVWPDYDDYQSKTTRVIPVFELAPVF
jgi:deazaflavin-dependent oxidoreductase (nitroreductase family)